MHMAAHKTVAARRDFLDLTKDKKREFLEMKLMPEQRQLISAYAAVAQMNEVSGGDFHLENGALRLKFLDNLHGRNMVDGIAAIGRFLEIVRSGKKLGDLSFPELELAMKARYVIRKMMSRGGGMAEPDFTDLWNIATSLLDDPSANLSFSMGAISFAKEAVFEPNPIELDMLESFPPEILERNLGILRNPVFKELVKYLVREQKNSFASFMILQPELGKLVAKGGEEKIWFLFFPSNGQVRTKLVEFDKDSFREIPDLFSFGLPKPILS